jgi:hypothetical protein
MISLTRRIALISLPCLFALGIRTARAAGDDLFRLNVNGTANQIKAGGSSVLSLISNLSNNEAQFAPFGNQNYTAALNYAGIPNAMKLTQSFDSSGNRIITVKVPSVGLNRTFSSANGDLGTQIKDFLKKDGLADLGRFQQIVDQTSLAGVVDGNPMAATALLADAGYQQFALHTHPGGGSNDSSFAGHGESWYSVQGGQVDAGGVSGAYVNFDIASEYHFNDRVALAFNAPGRWLTLRGANVFMGGALLGLPINIIPSHAGNGISWQLTPAAHAGLVGSADFASGGLIYGGQVDSALNYTIDGLTFTLADQAGYFHGASLDIAGYHFATDLDQWVFKNGVQVTKTWGNFFIDASGTWTNFLHNAFVDGYLSPEAGLGFRWGKNSGIRIAYTGNFGNHYHTNGGSVLLFFTN